MSSFTDEETFRHCFGGTDWAVMLIIAAGGATDARLRFNVGPQCQRRLQVAVDYTTDFAAKATSSWDAEYDQHVHALDPFQMPEPCSAVPQRDQREKAGNDKAPTDGARGEKDQDKDFSYAQVVEE